MKKYLIGSFIGFIIGIAATGFTIYLTAPGLMLMEDESKYDFEESVDKFTASIKAHDWKIPKVHDLQKTMKKYGKTVKPVQVFELCHPDHAEKILKRGDERIVSSLMPCRVAIYEKEDGKVYISRMNSGMMAQMIGGIVAEVMAQASKENEEILQAIIQTP